MAMPARQQLSLVVAAVLVAGLGSTQLALGKKKIKPAGMDDQKRALHALNRLTFGARPGDAERVTQLGVDKWIDLQLHPEKIDDSALDARLASFRTLRMDTHELVENFPNNEIIKQVAEGNAPMPTDPVRRAVYEAQVEKYEDKQDRKAAGGNAGGGNQPSGNAASGNSASGSAAGNAGERDASADASAMAMQADAAYE
ncbi:MAG: DUF1800 family protein, partial [Terriglobales bacterium]